MRHYRFIEFATQGYLALVGVMVLLFQGGRVNHPWLLVAAHAAVIVVIHLLVQAEARWPGHPVLHFLRHFYPILLYTGFYRETELLNRMIFPEFLDPTFVRLEERLFGGQPSLAFMSRAPQLWLSEFFYASYFSYYLMIAGVGLILLLRNRTQFFHFVSVVSFAFYICYFIFILLPVVGPRIFYSEVLPPALMTELLHGSVPPPYPDALQSGWCFNLMKLIYHHFEAFGAAFPSSHVVVAIVTAWFSWRYLPRLRWLHLALVPPLCAATVYCRYHYLVDVIAGVAVAMVLLPLGNSLYFRFERRLSPAEQKI
jgi:membrane-associated phospholipid phosphatase